MRRYCPARTALRICMPTARSRGAGSKAASDFGRRSMTTSELFRISPRSTPRVTTAASTVSITLPGDAQAGRRRTLFTGNFERDIEACVARFIADGNRRQFAAMGSV